VTQSGEPEPIKRVRNAHQSTLLLNAAHGLLGRKLGRYLLGEEVADNLPGAGIDLFTHDHSEGSKLSQLQGAEDGIVISYCNTTDLGLLTASNHLLQGSSAVR